MIPSASSAASCGRVEREGAGERDGGLALGLDPLADDPLDDAARRGDPVVLPGLPPLEGRQRGEVPLNQRFDCLQVEAPGEDEREVARVREAVLVEGERPIEVHLVDHCRRHRARPDVVLRHGGVEGLLEHEFWAGLLMGQHHLRLCRDRGDRGGVCARLSERQVDELEHRFQVLGRRAPAQPFVGVVDEGRDGHGFAGQSVPELDDVERPDAPGGDHLGGRPRRHEVLVAGERSAAGLVARKITPSSLKVVGIRTTFRPFESSHSVRP